MAEALKQRWKEWDQETKAFIAKFSWVFGAFGAVFVVYCVGITVLAKWQAIDLSGWVRHDAEMPVEISGDWLQGEYRPCLGVLSADGKQTSLACVGDSLSTHQHDLPVEFWGRIERSERVKISPNGRYLSPDTPLDWKCQRLQDSLKCWAQD